MAEEKEVNLVISGWASEPVEVELTIKLDYDTRRGLERIAEKL